ncbi:hypothetical protein SEA_DICKRICHARDS_15 [Microbacterium phage DickRichards]|uniref:hypothetical protein n=1 Tax=Microbacterium phage DickRichards TaxID=2776866 RepID=UPI0018A3C5C4|nr:hypothetical protein QDW35_gp15 [Microbacterium phage DickRichards]QOP66386.1 hypothetical protein SEA_DICKRICHARDS_15 [Microbacterium phage DickRichards]
MTRPGASLVSGVLALDVPHEIGDQAVLSTARAAHVHAGVRGDLVDCVLVVVHASYCSATRAGAEPPKT